MRAHCLTCRLRTDVRTLRRICPTTRARSEFTLSCSQLINYELARDLHLVGVLGACTREDVQTRDTAKVDVAAEIDATAERDKVLRRTLEARMVGVNVERHTAATKLGHCVDAQRPPCSEEPVQNAEHVAR